jgi:hypothetical protein
MRLKTREGKREREGEWERGSERGGVREVKGGKERGGRGRGHFEGNEAC